MKKHTQYLRAEHEAAKQQTTGADTRKLSLHVDGDTGVQSRIELDGFGVTHYIDGDTDMVGELVRRWNAFPDLLAALEDVLRYCVTPKGFPDAKHRTIEQQAAYDNARAAINKAKTL